MYSRLERFPICLSCVLSKVSAHHQNWKMQETRNRAKKSSIPIHPFISLLLAAGARNPFHQSLPKSLAHLISGKPRSRRLTKIFEQWPLLPPLSVVPSWRGEDSYHHIPWLHWRLMALLVLSIDILPLVGRRLEATAWVYLARLRSFWLPVRLFSRQA